MVEGVSPVAGNHVRVCMLLGLLCAGFLLAAMTEGDSPATLCYSCSSCRGFHLAGAKETPHAEEEHALATVKFHRVNRDVFPAVCAENNREVSPGPNPVGHISSAA